MTHSIMERYGIEHGRFLIKVERLGVMDDLNFCVIHYIISPLILTCSSLRCRRQWWKPRIRFTR